MLRNFLLSTLANCRGFSMMEIVMSMGMTVIVTGVGLALFTLGAKAQLTGEAILAGTNLKNEMQHLLSTEVNCRRMLTKNDTQAGPVITYAAYGDPIGPDADPYYVTLYSLQTGNVLYPTPTTQVAKDLFINQVRFVSLGWSRGNKSMTDIIYGTLILRGFLRGFEIKERLPITLIVDTSNLTKRIVTCRTRAPDTGRPPPLPACVPGQYLNYSRDNTGLTQWMCMPLT